MENNWASLYIGHLNCGKRPQVFSHCSGNSGFDLWILLKISGKGWVISREIHICTEFCIKFLGFRDLMKLDHRHLSKMFLSPKLRLPALVGLLKLRLSECLFLIK